MPGEWGSPYRAPCSGAGSYAWPPKRRWALGSCYQHRVGDHESSVTSIAVDNGGSGYTYATISFTPAGGDSGSGATATATINDGQITAITVTNGGHDYWAAPTVVIAGDGSSAAATATISGVPLYVNTQEGDPTPVKLGSCPSGTLIEGNCYERATSTNCGTGGTPNPCPTEGDYSRCRKTGWKSLLATKVWHGMFGFLQGYNSDSLVEHKYLTISVDVVHSVSGTTTSGGVPSSWNASGVRRWTWAVNRYSGILTLSGYSVSTTQNMGSAAGYSGLGLLVDYAQLLTCLAAMRYVSGAYVYTETGCAVLPTDEAGWLSWFQDAKAAWCTVNATADLDVTDSTIVLDAESSGSGDDGAGTTVTWTESLDVQITLGDQYTAAALTQTPFDLLESGGWDFTDDAQYPWRMDGSCTKLPYLSFNEISPAQTPDQGTPTDGDYTDPNSEAYLTNIAATNPGSGYTTASVIITPTEGGGSGASATANISGGQINSYTIDEVGEGYYTAPLITIIGDGSGATATATVSEAYDGRLLGGPLPDGYGYHYSFVNSTWASDPLPRTTKEWVENLGPLPSGVEASAGGWMCFENCQRVYVQIWAEINDGWPSYNFFRPCGADRVRIDKRDESYVAAYDPDDTYCSHPGHADLLLFPNAHALCGRVAVSSAANDGADVDIELAESGWFKDGDQVDFTGLSGLGAGETVSVGSATVIETSLLTVAGKNLTEDYTSGGYAQSTGSPSYYWNDTNSKGDYVFMGWDYDVSSGDPETFDYVETCTQSCLQRKACCPSVMCVSPFAHEWCNGNNHWASEFKSMFGTNWYWIGLCASHMADPLYQPYDPLCDEADTTPLIEARCSAPDGAPSMPSGFYFGASNPPTWTNSWLEAPNPYQCWHGDEWEDDI